MVCHQSKDRRHEAGAHVGGSHLDADECLGPVCSEALRCGVDDTGVHRRTAKAHDDQPCQGRVSAQGQEDSQHACKDQDQTQPDHPGIVKAHGEKAAGPPSHGDADVEEAGVESGGLGGDAFVEHKVAGCPEPCRLLQGAVAEEGHHDLFCPGDGGDLL